MNFCYLKSDSHNIDNITSSILEKRGTSLLLFNSIFEVISYRKTDREYIFLDEFSGVITSCSKSSIVTKDYKDLLYNKYLFPFNFILKKIIFKNLKENNTNLFTSQETLSLLEKDGYTINYSRDIVISDTSNDVINFIKKFLL